MKNILVVCPIMTDATSFYRGMGPLTRLRQDYQEISLVFATQYNWATITIADLVFLQRPYRQEDLGLAELCKKYKVPLWIDYDDDLFMVPRDNPTFKVYGQDSIKKNVAKLCAMASAISVSTQAIKDRLEPLNKNITIIPNAIDDHRWSRSPRVSPRHNLVFWRGSATHLKDVLTVGQQLVASASDPRFKRWKFNFLGDEPVLVTERFPENMAICHPGLEPGAYMDFLNALNPALMIVPLMDSPFNRSKSNIAWIEGVYAGAAIVAPDLPEFRRPGVINYKGNKEFGETLNRCLAGEENLQQKNEEGWECIKETATLTKVNHLRMSLIDALIRRRPMGYESSVVATRSLASPSPS